MPRKIPPLLGLALTNLLSAHGWKASELAAEAGLAPSTLSAYANGDSLLSRERLEWLATKMKLGPVEVERAIVAAGLLRPEPPPPASPVDPTEEEWRVLDMAVAFGLREVEGLLRAVLLRQIREENARRDREEAEELFQRLKRFSPAVRRVLAEGGPEYHTWAVCVRLCDESERSAAHNADRALEWAEIACTVARQVPGSEAFRSRLRGFAEPFRANALRVKGDLPDSAAAFADARQLWLQGTDEAGLLDEGRVLDLEASLRRTQGLFSEALKLHDEALEVAQPDQTGVLLLNKAYTLEEKGDYEVLHRDS